MRAPRRTQRRFVWDGGKFSVGIVQRIGGTIRTSLVDASVPAHACYAVSAIRGGSESATGAPWCAPGPVAIGNHARTTLDERPPAGRLIGAAQPTSLHRTNDVRECQRHAGNFFCAALKGDAANLLVIVWDAGPAASAYHLYRTDGGQRTLVATQDQRFAGVLPSALGLESVVAGSCFSVTETRDAVESVPSDPYCVGNDVPAKAQTVVLAPTHERSSRSYRGHTPKIGSGGTNWSGFDIWPGLVVGYEHSTNDMGLPGDEWANNIYRTGLFFDLAFLADKHVDFARLEIRIDETIRAAPHDHTVSYDSYTNCVATVAAGVDTWWTQNTPLVHGEPSIAVNGTGGRVRFDMSDIARAWAAHTANFGLVLVGANEDLAAFTEATCRTRFVDHGAQAPTLTVRYHSSSRGSTHRVFGE